MGNGKFCRFPGGHFSDDIARFSFGRISCHRGLKFRCHHPEASCHWGTRGTCPPPGGVATLVNSLQNRVKSITLCATLNANTGKIVLVTLCIQIDWLFSLFCNAFWSETVTRKWRWLHPGHGGTCPHFYKWLHGTGHRTKDKKVIKLYWPQGSAYQNDWLYL